MTNWPIEFCLDAPSFAIYSEIGEPIIGQFTPGYRVVRYEAIGVRGDRACKDTADWLSYELRKRDARKPHQVQNVDR